MENPSSIDYGFINFKYLKSLINGSRYNMQTYNKLLEKINNLRLSKQGTNIYFLDHYDTNICFDVDTFDRLKSQSSELRYYDKNRLTIKNFNGISFVENPNVF